MNDFKSRLRQALRSTDKVKYKKGGYKYTKGGFIYNAGGGDQIVYGARHSQGGVMRDQNTELEGGGFDSSGNPKAGEVITTIYDDGGTPREFYMSYKNGVAQKYLNAKAANGGMMSQDQKQEFAKLNESMNPEGSPEQIAMHGGLKNKYHAGGLYHNINHRKKKGTSRSKKNSTISDKAYSNMKSGFKNANGGMRRYFMGGVNRTMSNQSPINTMGVPTRTADQQQEMSMQALDNYKAMRQMDGGYKPMEYGYGGQYMEYEGGGLPKWLYKARGEAMKRNMGMGGYHSDMEYGSGGLPKWLYKARGRAMGKQMGYGGYPRERYEGGGPNASFMDMYEHGGLHNADGSIVDMTQFAGPNVPQYTPNQTVVSPYVEPTLGENIQTHASKVWNVVTNPLEAFGRSIHNQDWYDGTLGMGVPVSPNLNRSVGPVADVVNFANPASYADAIGSLVSDIGDEGFTTENMASAAFMLAFKKRFPKSTKDDAANAFKSITLRQNKQGKFVMDNKFLPARSSRSLTTTGGGPPARTGNWTDPVWGSGVPGPYKGPYNPTGDLLKATAAGTALYMMGDGEEEEVPITLGNLEGGDGSKIVDGNNNGVPDYLEKPTDNTKTDTKVVDKVDTKTNNRGKTRIPVDENVRNQQNILLDRGYELPKYGADGRMGNETETALNEMNAHKNSAAAGYGVSPDDLEWDPTMTGEKGFGTAKGGWRPKEGAANIEWGDTWDAEAGEWRDDADTVYYDPEGNVISKEEHDAMGVFDGTEKIVVDDKKGGKKGNFFDRIGLNNITDAIEMASILKANRYAQKQNEKIGQLNVKSQKVRAKTISPELVDMNQEKADAQTVGTTLAQEAMKQGKSIAEIRALQQQTQDSIRKIGLTEEQEQLKQRNFAQKLNVSMDLQAQGINVSNDRQDQIANNDAMASMFKNSIALSQNMRDAISTKIKDTKLLKAAENEMLVINQAIAGGTGTDVRKGIDAINRLLNKGVITEDRANELSTNLNNMYNLENEKKDTEANE